MWPQGGKRAEESTKVDTIAEDWVVRVVYRISVAHRNKNSLSQSASQPASQPASTPRMGTMVNFRASLRNFPEVSEVTVRVQCQYH